MMSVIGTVQSRYREAVQWVKEIYGGKDLLKRLVLSLEWKSEEVMDDESGDDDRDELRSGWGGESRQEWWGWRNESGSKNGVEFWKCWRANFQPVNKCVEVENIVDSDVIVGKFAAHFSSSYIHTTTQMEQNDYTTSI